MKKVQLPAATLLLMSLLSGACGRTIHTSKVLDSTSGIVQNGDWGNRDETPAFAGMQTAVAEFAEPQDAIVSSFTIQNTGSDFLEALASGVQKSLTILVDSDTDQSALKSKISNLSSELQSKVSIVASPATRADRGVDKNPWARDWGPVAARSSSGKLRYLDFTYKDGKSFADTLPSFLGALRGVDVVKSPLVLEGGNFMIAPNGACFVTTKLLNFAKLDDRNQADVEAQLKDYAGCKTVEWFEPLSFEKSARHIDELFKIIAGDVVLVPEVTNDTILFYSDKNGIDFEKERLAAGGKKFRDKANFDFLRKNALDLQKVFNENANRLSIMGFKPIRLPMPLDYTGLLTRTYINSIQFGSTLVFPSFREDAEEKFKYFDQPLLLEMEKTVASRLAAAGFTAQFVGIDEIVQFGGSVHCATMLVPSQP